MDAAATDKGFWWSSIQDITKKPSEDNNETKGLYFLYGAPAWRRSSVHIWWQGILYSSFDLTCYKSYQQRKTHLANHCSLENQHQHYLKITVSLIYSKKIFLVSWTMTSDQHSDGLLLDQRDQVLLGMLIQDWQVHGILFFVAEKGLSPFLFYLF